MDVIELAESLYGKYKDWSGKNRQQLREKVPWGESALSGLDWIDKAVQTPGMEYAMPSFAPIGAFTLKTNPVAKGLYVDYLKTESPHDIFRALRQILEKAQQNKAQNILFHPEAENLAPGAKRSMADIAKKLGATSIKGELTKQIPVSKIEDILGITKQRSRNIWEDRLRGWSMDKEILFSDALKSEQRASNNPTWFAAPTARKHAEGMLNKAIELEEFIKKMANKYDIPRYK